MGPSASCIASFAIYAAVLNVVTLLRVARRRLKSLALYVLCSIEESAGIALII